MAGPEGLCKDLPDSNSDQGEMASANAPDVQPRPLEWSHQRNLVGLKDLPKQSVKDFLASPVALPALNHCQPFMGLGPFNGESLG